LQSHVTMPNYFKVTAQMGHLQVAPTVVMVFALTFSFSWFSLLILHVFAAVYLQCFSVISFITMFCHSLFKAFLRIFMTFQKRLIQNNLGGYLSLS
jgi:hypothetical protein